MSLEKMGIGFFDSNIILYLAQIYADPFAVIRELVQNALDKNAGHVIVDIDCFRGGLIKSYDDGRGASKEEIVSKFKQIGRSLKLDDPEALGEKGIGNLAGLAIAERYRLITKDRDNNLDKFRVYWLDKAEIRGSANVDLNIEDWQPKKVASNLPFDVSAMVELNSITEMALRRLSDLAGLERYINDELGRKIAKNKVEVKLNYRDQRGKKTERIIKPLEFRGVRMEPEIYETKFGPIAFEFFYTDKPAEKPRILIEHRKTYTMSLFNLFLRKQLDEKAAVVYQRGFFEGIIKVDFCALAPSRDCFEWNAELETLSGILSRFAIEVLKPVIEHMEDEQRKEKYQHISGVVLKMVMELFKKEPHLIPLKFRRYLSERVLGDKNSDGKKARKKRAKNKIGPDVLRTQREKIEKNQQTKEKTVVVDSGNKKSEEGFELRYVSPSEETGFMWHSKTATDGIVEINSGHKDFRSAERLGTTRLTEYIFILFQKELTCGSLEDAASRIFCEHFEKEFLGFYRAALMKAE